MSIEPSYPPSESPELARLRELAAALVQFAEHLQAFRDSFIDCESHCGDQGGASCRTLIRLMSEVTRSSLDTVADFDPGLVPAGVLETLRREYP